MPLAPPAHVRGGYAPTAEPCIREQRFDRARRRSTSRSCRRRGSTGSGAAGRRALRAAPCMRSSPKPSFGHGLRGLDDPLSRRLHRAPAGSARASRARPRRPRRERCRRSARSRASSRRGRSPCCSRALSAATLPFARPAGSGFTTASKMRRSSPSSLGSTPLRRKIDRRFLHGSRAHRASASSPASGHGRDDQPRLARRQVRPDLFGHVRHRRVQELQQPLERRDRRRARVGVAVVEPRLRSPRRTSRRSRRR